MLYILHLCMNFGKDIKIPSFPHAFALVHYAFRYELTPLFPGGVECTHLTLLASFHFYELVLLPVLVVVWYADI